jgi:hypothetical protein
MRNFNNTLMEGRIMWLFLPNNVGDSILSMMNKTYYTSKTLYQWMQYYYPQHTYTRKQYTYLYIDNIWQHHMRVMKEPSLLHTFFLLKKKKDKRKITLIELLLQNVKNVFLIWCTLTLSYHPCGCCPATPLSQSGVHYIIHIHI